MKIALLGASTLVAALAAWPQPVVPAASMWRAGACVELSADLAPLGSPATALVATESVAAEATSLAPAAPPARPLFKDRATLDRELAALLACDLGGADER